MSTHNRMHEDPLARDALPGLPDQENYRTPQISRSHSDSNVQCESMKTNKESFTHGITQGMPRMPFQHIRPAKMENAEQKNELFPGCGEAEQGETTTEPSSFRNRTICSAKELYDVFASRLKICPNEMD